MFKKGHIPWNKGLGSNDSRIRLALEKRKITMLERYGEKGIVGWNKGRKTPIETRAKQSESAKRRWLREREIIIAAQTKGKLASEKFRTKNVGRKYTPEQRERMIREVLPKMIAGWRNSPKWLAAIQSPENAFLHSQQSKKRWADPNHRRKMLVASKAGQKYKGSSIERLTQESLARNGITFLANFIIDEVCEADVLLAEKKVAIFCDGCYWHDCPTHGSHHWTRRRQFGLDKKFTGILIQRGWRVIRIWEHEIKADPDIVLKKLKELEVIA